MRDYVKLLSKVPIAVSILYLAYSTILIYELSQVRYRTDIDDFMIIAIAYYAWFVYPVDLTLTSDNFRLRQFLLRMPIVGIIVLLILVCIVLYFLKISMKLGIVSSMFRDIRIVRTSIDFNGDTSSILIITIVFSIAIGFLLYLIQVIMEWKWLKLSRLLSHIFAATIIALLLYSITIFLFSDRVLVSVMDKTIYFVAGFVSIVIHRFFYRYKFSANSSQVNE